ncbi:acyl-CoA/acyl-ACP dehydrogenase [Kineosporia rhizophila]|uniref:acyl-CoA dehydrogenase family protein n=1 Tax=Kineosporia rhizophila TaxID=84633 RepID=UPI001E2F8755|nr:acyl-CoA/acyl-ACP dehydrogenase [Kineosporia rhizophila]
MTAQPETVWDLDEVRDQLAKRAEENDRTGAFPWESIQVVHEAGLLRAGIGSAYGGPGLSSAEAVRLFLALGAGDPSVALLTAMTVFQHQLQATAPWWPEETYRKVVADSWGRPVLLNAVRAEPEWGAPARGGLPATTVSKVEGGWILNGRKGFATGSEGLAYHLVWATTSTDPDDDPLLAHAVVPGDTPGIEVIRTWDHLGLRATSTHDVVYTDVFVPEENFRGVPLSQQGRDVSGSAVLGLAALYVGVARAAQAWFVKFANERVPTSLGRPIATTERIQSVAGEIEVQLIQAEEVLFGLAARVDAHDPVATQRLLSAKLIATRSAVTAVQTAVAALGNPALTRHNPLQRHLRDVLCSRVHPPQDDAALLIAGRASLKTP